MTVTIDDIRAAAAGLAGQIIRTPTVAAPALSHETGAEVYLKLENLQTTGSFKVRGSHTKLVSLSSDERACGVVAASAGNHAQGVAFHAGRLGIEATIFMPEGTPFTKVGRTEALGAKVVLEGVDFNESRQAALAHAAKTGMIFIPPFDDEAVIAGQGTAALEMLEDQPDLDTLIVPIGGGGLMAGCAVAAKALNPDVAMVGVQTALYPSMERALKNKPFDGEAGPTVADGIAVKSPGEITHKIIAQHVDEVLLASEVEIESAIQGLVEQQRLVAEGAGASGVAGLRKAAGRFAGRKVGIVISGGNIDSRLLSSILMRGLVRAGRLVRLRIEISDVPGALSKVSGIIGGHGGNIVEVYHQRLFNDMPVRRTDIDVVVETVDSAHMEEIIKHLQDNGFPTRDLSRISL